MLKYLNALSGNLINPCVIFGSNLTRFEILLDEK